MSLRFISQLQVDGLPDEQLDNQFEVIMPELDITPGKGYLNGLYDFLGTSKYTPIVESIVFGVTNFKTTTRRIRTGWVNVPEDIENYNDVAITMFCSNNMLTQYYLAAWKALVFNPTGEYYNPMSVYKKNIEVFFYGGASLGTTTVPVAHYTLQGCFPYNLDDYKLGYSDDPKRLTLSQRFKVDKVVSENSMATRAITAELLSNPTAIVGNLLSNVPGGASDYSLSDTYS